MSKSTHSHNGHSRKHTSQHKHSGTKKHKPPHQRKPHHHKSPYASTTPLTVKVKHTKHPKARGLAEPRVSPGITPFASRERLDGPGARLADWECCAAEALAASLRLAGWPVGDEDVMALHLAAGGGQDVPVSIPAVLEAAGRLGLAGVRPRGFEPCGDALQRSDEWIGHAVEVDGLDSPGKPLHPFGRDQHGLIVGAELPGGPHALVLDGPGVWSWGEWHPWGCFPGAVLEEAWVVAW